MNLDLSPVTLNYDCEGDLTGTKFDGVFTVRPILGYTEKFDVDFDRRSLMGNPKVDEQVATEVQNLAFALSQLRLRVVTGPTWFSESQGLRIGWLDTNVVYDLLEKVMDIETKWRAALKEKAVAAKAALAK